MVNIQNLFDDAKCFQTVRDMRWPDGVARPSCRSTSVVKKGRDDTQPDRQRYERRFDDLSGTAFAGHHPSLPAWVACLYLMGLNLSGLQIARELGIDKSDARDMITTLHQGIVDRTLTEELSGEVACDEVYVVAGHKGHPEAVQKKGDSADDDA
jgi:transposase-like protein